MERALASAHRAGLSPAALWTMTPWQLGVVLKAEAEERRDAYDRLGWAAWHTAALGRVKTMPPLRQMMARREAGGDVAARLKATLKATLPIDRR